MNWEHVWIVYDGGTQHVWGQEPPVYYQRNAKKITKLDRFATLELDLEFKFLSRYAHLETPEGVPYLMFPTEFSELVPHMVNGKVKGTFRWNKRSDAVGIKLVKAK